MFTYFSPWTFIAGLVGIVGLSAMIPELREMARVTLFGSRNTGAAFDSELDIPSMAGKVILITGAAGDLGRQTTIELAKHGRPDCIYIADLPRDEATKQAVVEHITREAFGGDHHKTDGPKTKIRFLELDLTSFSSIQECAAEFLSKDTRLDTLVLNAGIIRIAPGTTKEGYEVHFGINYLGHALLAQLLMPTLVHTAHQPGTDVRIVVISSEGHAMAPKEGIQFDKLKTDCVRMSYASRYGQSKLALISLAKELAKRHPELKVAAVHPGRILTGMAVGLWKESLLARATKSIAPFFCVPVSVGIINHLWVVSSSKVVSGTYYEPVGVPDKESALAKDKELSDKLWKWTTNELKDMKPFEPLAAG